MHVYPFGLSGGPRSRQDPAIPAIPGGQADQESACGDGHSERRHRNHARILPLDGKKKEKAGGPPPPPPPGGGGGARARVGPGNRGRPSRTPAKNRTQGPGGRPRWKKAIPSASSKPLPSENARGFARR